MVLVLVSCGSTDDEPPPSSAAPVDDRAVTDTTSDGVADAVQETAPSVPALGVAEQAYRLYEQGDAEGWFALWAPSATWQQTASGDTQEFELFGTDGLFSFASQAQLTDWDGGGEITISDIEARTLAEFHASGGAWNAECTGDDGPTVMCSLDPVTAFGAWSQGKVRGARPDRAQPATAVFTITDGTIDRLELSFEILDDETVFDRQANQQEYRSWLIDTHADESDQLVGGSIGELSITPENRLRHRELVAEWLAQQ